MHRISRAYLFWERFTFRCFEGKLTEGKRVGTIYIDGQKIDDWEILNQKIYCLRPDNYIIEDWTVAEYLCLVDSGWSWSSGEEAG